MPSGGANSSLDETFASALPIHKHEGHMRASIQSIIMIVVGFGFLLLPTGRLETAALHDSPFQFTGDGQLAIHDVQTGERIAIVYRDDEGRYDDAALEAIDHTLRCHGAGKTHPISLKLIELIDHMQDHFDVPNVRVVSGYRSPEHNARLRRRLRRVAHDSHHIRGMAMDIRFDGVGKRTLGKYARALRAGGVGVYRRSTFVHIDVGPVRSW